MSVFNISYIYIYLCVGGPNIQTHSDSVARFEDGRKMNQNSDHIIKFMKESRHHQE